MEKKERLKSAFKYLKSIGILHTQKDLANKMQASPQNVSSAFKGEEKVLTDKFLKRFCETFQVFNLNWLLTGEGSMLKSEGSSMLSPAGSFAVQKSNTDTESTSPLLDLINQKDIIIREQAEEIGQLKEQVRQLTVEKERLASLAHSSGVANVG